MSPRQKRHSAFRRTTCCPVCAEAGCLLTGPTSQPVAVVCKRVESVKMVGMYGWVHVLNDRGPVWTRWRDEVRRMAREATTR